jgi:hypothetical protein
MCRVFAAHVRAPITHVALQVQGFIEAMKRDFYRRKLRVPDEQALSDAQVAQYIFATTPSHGAALLDAAAVPPSEDARQQVQAQLAMA